MFSFPELYEEAVGRAGGEQSTAEDVIRVERAVRIVLERWMARGYNTWRIATTTVIAVPGSPSVQLPECVDDVLRVSAVRPDFTTTVDLLRMGASEYMLLSNKLRGGTPSQYWLERSVPNPQLHVFPIGEEGGTQLTVWYVERPQNYERGNSEASSVPGRWLEALVLGVAHDLARKRPNDDGTYNENLIARLDAEAKEAEDIAQRADRDRSRFEYRTTY